MDMIQEAIKRAREERSALAQEKEKSQPGEKGEAPPVPAEQVSLEGLQTTVLALRGARR